MDTDGLLVCRGTEQKIPAKVTENCDILCLSSVRPTSDMFTLHYTNAVSKQLVSIGLSNETELSAEHSKLFSDWCSEWRKVRSMSINRLYFENRFTNLSRRIFTDPSEEVLWIVSYLRNEATLKWPYIIAKCCVAPIRDMTIPIEFQSAVYGVRLRKHTQRARCRNWQNLSLDGFINCPTEAASSAKVTTSQVFVANSGEEIPESSSM